MSKLSRLEELPPSAKLVLKILEELGEAQFTTLLLETRLPRRTLLDALGKLKKMGVIEARPCLRDLRRKVYCYTLTKQKEGMIPHW
ncbi:MAG: MarR family transcriptional regulator [Thermoprotei archaeon]